MPKSPVLNLLAAGIIEQIEADPTPVSNEATMRRAIEAAKRGAEKIVAAMASAGVPATGGLTATADHLRNRLKNIT